MIFNFFIEVECAGADSGQPGPENDIGREAGQIIYLWQLFAFLVVVNIKGTEWITVPYLLFTSYSRHRRHHVLG
jgi:hypothetical protein